MSVIYYPKENLRNANIINIFTQKRKIDGIIMEELQENKKLPSNI